MSVESSANSINDGKGEFTLCAGLVLEQDSNGWQMKCWPLFLLVFLD